MNLEKDRDFLYCPFTWDVMEGRLKDEAHCDPQLLSELGWCIKNAQLVGRASSSNWLTSPEDFTKLNERVTTARLFIWAHGNSSRESIADGIGNTMNPDDVADHLDQDMGLSRDFVHIIVWACYAGMPGGYAQALYASLRHIGYEAVRVGGFKELTGSVQPGGVMDLPIEPSSRSRYLSLGARGLDLAGRAPIRAGRAPVHDKLQGLGEIDDQLIWYPNDTMRPWTAPV